jgi:hypothetical protein
MLASSASLPSTQANTTPQGQRPTLSNIASNSKVVEEWHMRLAMQDIVTLLANMCQYLTKQIPGVRAGMDWKRLYLVSGWHGACLDAFGIVCNEQRRAGKDMLRKVPLVLTLEV